MLIPIATVALILLIISVVTAVINRTWPSPLEWAVWAIAVIIIGGRLG